MSKSKKARTRRHRRSNKATLKHGPEAKRRHAHPSGRTGRIRSRNLSGNH